MNPRTAATLLSNKASLFFAVGLRQVYFSLLLFAWLAGPWALTVVTILYFLFVYYIESVDRVCGHSLDVVIAMAELMKE